MSAIAGILYLGGAPVENGLIETLTESMSARGPDEQHHWAAGSIALGHCMLRTTPESLEEHQPLTSQDKSLVLVWDGRLDNRDELRRSLLSAGVILRDNSDAELVLHSYAVWEKECPKRMLGDFAFAVWDSRRQRLFCAVDHIGARPFYYAVNERCFAFASEEEVLIGLPGVSGRPNELQIADYLALSGESYADQYSWLRDVQGLMPGHSLTVLPSGAKQTARYWRLEASDETAFGSVRECEEAFLAVFGDAVRSRMRLIGDPAAMMSGGMDSASIASMVQRLLPEVPGKQFHTYSAIADEAQDCVESQCIESLTRSLGDNAHTVSVPSFTGMVGVQDLIETAWSKAHPIDNSILLPAMMCLAASRHGDHVLLNGVSGDLTLHIPDRYPAHLLRAGRWQRAWLECLGISRNHTFLHGTSPVSLLLQNAWTAFTPGGIKTLAYRLRSKESPLAQSAINLELARKLQLADRLHLQWAQQAEARRVAGYFQQLQPYVQALSGPWGFVSGLTGYERVAGRYGVELRDPWADKRVVEFFLRLPLQHKVRDGWTKYLVRTTLVPGMERKVQLRRSKEHLGRLFAGRLMDETEVFVARTLERKLEILEPYVDIKLVRSRYAKYGVLRNPLDQEFIFQITSLTLWAERISK